MPRYIHNCCCGQRSWRISSNEGKDRSAVINVTGLYLSENVDLSVKRAVGSAAGPIDESRSFVEDIKTFPTNVEVRSVLTFRATRQG